MTLWTERNLPALLPKLGPAQPNHLKRSAILAAVRVSGGWCSLTFRHSAAAQAPGTLSDLRLAPDAGATAGPPHRLKRNTAPAALIRVRPSRAHFAPTPGV